MMSTMATVADQAQAKLDADVTTTLTIFLALCVLVGAAAVLSQFSTGGTLQACPTALSPAPPKIPPSLYSPFAPYAQEPIPTSPRVLGRTCSTISEAGTRHRQCHEERHPKLASSPEATQWPSRPPSPRLRRPSCSAPASPCQKPPSSLLRRPTSSSSLSGTDPSTMPCPLARRLSSSSSYSADSRRAPSSAGSAMSRPMCIPQGICRSPAANERLRKVYSAASEERLLYTQALVSSYDYNLSLITSVEMSRSAGRLSSSCPSPWLLSPSHSL